MPAPVEERLARAVDAGADTAGIPWSSDGAQEESGFCSGDAMAILVRTVSAGASTAGISLLLCYFISV